MHYTVMYCLTHSTSIATVWFCPSLSDLDTDRKKERQMSSSTGAELVANYMFIPLLTVLSVITSLTLLFAKLIIPLSHTRRWMSSRLQWLQTGTGLCFYTELLRWTERKKLICSSWQHRHEKHTRSHKFPEWFLTVFLKNCVFGTVRIYQSW